MIFNRYLNTNKGKFNRRKNLKMSFECWGKPLSSLTIFSGLDNKDMLRNKPDSGCARLMLSTITGGHLRTVPW